MDYIKLFKAHLWEQQRSKNTIDCYSRDIMGLEGWSSIYGDVGLQELAQINLTHFSKFLKSSGQAYITINRKIASINTFYKFMYEKGYSQEKLFIKPFKIRTQLEFKGLDERELWKIRTEIHKGKNKMHICIFEILLNTGIRVSELVGIKLSDIQISQRKGKLTVLGKGDVVRIIPLNKDARKAIKDYLEVRRNVGDYLLIGQRGVLKRNAVNLILKKYGQKVGIIIKTHMLRHTLGFRLVKNNVEITTIQQILGHSNLQITNIYSMTSRNEVEEAIEGLEW